MCTSGFFFFFGGGEYFWGGGGCGRILTFPTSRVGAYSRLGALIIEYGIYFRQPFENIYLNKKIGTSYISHKKLLSYLVYQRIGLKCLNWRYHNPMQHEKTNKRKTKNHYTLWYISLPSSAKQRRKMTKI